MGYYEIREKLLNIREQTEKKTTNIRQAVNISKDIAGSLDMYIDFIFDERKMKLFIKIEKKDINSFIKKAEINNYISLLNKIEDGDYLFFETLFNGFS